MKVTKQVNIYRRCSSQAMRLLRTAHFNPSQKEALDYVQALSNDVGLITGSAAIDKTTLVLNLLLSFCLETAERTTSNIDIT